MGLLAWISYPFTREPRRPLSQRQPQSGHDSRTPLGLEAIDMSVVESVNRTNASLERVSPFFGTRRGFGSFLEKAENHLPPMADDETYAARYHRAYNQKKGDNQ